MAWGRLEDKLHDNEKLAQVSDAAYRLWVQALSWSNDKLTDGFVPSTRPARLVDLRNPKKTIAELIAIRLWHYSGRPCQHCLELRRAKQVVEDIPLGGYLIHDFHEYNRPAWAIRADRDRMRELGRRGGVRSGEVRSSANGAEAPRSSATLPEDEAAVEGERSATLDRTAQAPRSSAALKRHAQAEGPISASGTLKPVPPYPRSPESDSSRTSRARANGPHEPDPVPDEPELPQGTGSVDPGARSPAGRRAGLRHISEARRA